MVSVSAPASVTFHFTKSAIILLHTFVGQGHPMAKG